ncbi:hypothetical protein O6H91_01G146600 [Diphasiastrum complanatum]|uniref:Uncharacterized protein n=1 Tax=Diphasiastrum complanatum TaxID=34168 RepID=A0ACC2EWV1_DIPCM|nr:hypothetical protein O6H91_Y006900 [Diphasiastrum complanatum]KAJ7571049.1 hypothetical protein O6H91_01G146600 [Diphasiastrum complanatum]
MLGFEKKILRAEECKGLMGKEANQTHIYQHVLEYDRLVRSEVMRGCQQVREMEHRLKLADPGCLGFSDSSSSNVKALRANLMGSAAAIVSNFSNVITFLNANPFAAQQMSQGVGISFGIESMNVTATIGKGEQAEMHFNAEEKKICTEGTNLSCQNVESPISTARTAEARSPSPSPLLVGSKRSPQRRYGALTDRALTDPTMSLSLEGETPADEIMRGSGGNDQADSSQIKQTSAAKKRKFMPKWTFKVPIDSAENGNEMPPADGFNWRKYGQKDILGSRYPRSYYRCTNKTEFGCPAIKYVQRLDEDPPVFNVTLKGEHTCPASRNHCPSLSYFYPALATDCLQRAIFPADANFLTRSSIDSFTNPSSAPDMKVPSISPPLSAFKSGFDRHGNPVFKSSSILSPNIVTPRFGFNPYSVQSSQAGVSNQNEDFGLSLLDSGPDILSGLFSAHQCNGNSSIQAADEIKGNLKQKYGCKAEATELPECISAPSMSGMRTLNEILDFEDICFHFPHPKGSTLNSFAKEAEAETSRELQSPATSSVVSNSLLSSTLHSTISSVSLSHSTAQPNVPTPESEFSEVVAEHTPACTFSLGFMLDNEGVQQHVYGVDYEPVSFTNSLLFGSE